jgi:excinuclease ABC subunit C
VPVELEAVQGITQVLSERRGTRTKILAPKRGTRVKLLRMAMENAVHSFSEKARAKERLEERLSELQRALALKVLPRRIECVDVSHSGGEDTVASIVTLVNAEPYRRAYKSFHVRHVRKGDDYGAMRHVLARRFAQSKRDREIWRMPDLLVIDGGRGQLDVALLVLRELELSESLSVVSLAKERTDAGKNPVGDRVFVPGWKGSITLRGGASALQVLALARDEAHRASNTLRLRVGKRRVLRSEVDDLPGIGPKTRAKLLRALGSMRGVLRSSADELCAAGITQAQARTIVEASARRRREDRQGGSRLDEAEQTAIENAFEE